ncbi:hypothetical protein BpHYR1_002390 [Brachionus plicatilis]|uniref:Uncharacterized protein n=1 Tax=Brachionus plicatilis TaxID=10195 RepID=A0A3M7QG48_BRAPC|nr:hypothetical protein BpHYR1_002390 [Brachionus plicatilis]
MCSDIPTNSSAIIDNVDADNIKKFKSCDVLLKDRSTFIGYFYIKYSNCNRNMGLEMEFIAPNFLYVNINFNLRYV